MTTQILTVASRRSPGRLLDRLQARRQAAVARRIERVTCRELVALGDHLLRDMGLHRDEIAGFSRSATDRLAPEIKLRPVLFL